jgi:predicted DsbA family dithiol-disulfide isomerase
MTASSSIPHTSHFAVRSRHKLLRCGLLLFASILSLTVKAQSPKTIVARVSGQVITQEEVDDTVISQIFALQQQLFALRKTALNNLITKKLLEDEASRQKLSLEQLKSKWMSGPVTVDPAQVNELYLKNLSAFGLMSPDEAKEKLRLDLEGQVRLKRYRDELDALRRQTRIEVILEEPRLRLSRLTVRGSSKGPVDAKVVITEFSDFQCPYCRQVQSTLTRVLQQYPADVRLEFKYLPLEIHPLAFTAARAAYCAGKQGSFWRFHDALFESEELSLQKVQSISHNLNLNLQEFETCLQSAESQTAITADLQEAQRLGIDGTPSFIINGKLLRGVASFEEFNNAIVHELNGSQPTTSTSPK